MSPCRLDIDFYGYRSATDFCSFCVKTYNLTNQNRGFKINLFHTRRYYPLASNLAGFDSAGKVDIAKYDTTKYSSVLIRVLGLQNNPDCRITILLKIVIRACAFAAGHGVSPLIPDGVYPNKVEAAKGKLLWLFKG
jgi:hypothetical protein